MEYSQLVELSWDSLSLLGKMKTPQILQEFLAAIAHYAATVETRHWQALTGDQPSAKFSSAWLISSMNRQEPLKSNVQLKNFKRVLHAFMCGSSKREAGKEARRIVAAIFYKFAELRHQANLFPDFGQRAQQILQIGHDFIIENPEWQPILKIPPSLQSLDAYQHAATCPEIDASNQVRYVASTSTSVNEKNIRPRRETAQFVPILPNNTLGSPIPSTSTALQLQHNVASHVNMNIVKHEFGRRVKIEPPEQVETQQQAVVPHNNNNTQSNKLSRIYTLKSPPGDVSQLSGILLTTGAELYDFHTRMTTSGNYNYSGNIQDMLQKMKELFENHLSAASLPGNSTVVGDASFAPAVAAANDYSDNPQTPDAIPNDANNDEPPIDNDFAEPLPVENGQYNSPPAEAEVEAMDTANSENWLGEESFRSITSGSPFHNDFANSDIYFSTSPPPSSFDFDALMFDSCENGSNVGGDSCYYRETGL